MLIGEMRDQETVDIAIKAALTGHLVFSTIHTNDSAATVHRLMNMNIEPFLIADSLALVVAQRLVRRVCRKCGAPTKLPVKPLIEMGFSPEEAETVNLMQGRGCELCHNTGYKGRTALFEVMELNPAIRDLILVRAQSKEIKKMAIESGMITMRRSGLVKIMAGVTTPEEVLRETVKDQ
jgi:type IV pilus assembly protein PilB